MTGIKKIILVILWIAITILYCYFFRKCQVDIQTSPEESIEKIDSLGSKIDSIYIVKDSICEKIDTVYIKLEDNNKQYEENFNRVINNDANEDYVFFLNYINSNRERLDSIGNCL